MGNPFPAFYDGLRAAISAAWPNVAGSSHPIYRESQVRRVAWRKLIETQRLASPWVVISISDSPQVSGWGLTGIVYAPRVEVFYISEAVDGEKDMAKFIEGELTALVDVLYPWAQGFRFAARIGIDTSPQNPAQAAFLRDNLPLFAGSVSFDVHFADGDLPVLFDPKYLSVCQLQAYTIAGTSATPDNTRIFDLLPAIDNIAYSANGGLVEISSEDGPIESFHRRKETFTLSLGVIDGDGRENLLTDIWHQRHRLLRFSLRAKLINGTDGKWLVAVCVPDTLRNGVIYSKNATIMTLKPTADVLPQWTTTPTI